MHVLFLAMNSLWHRRLASALTVVGISLSVALYVGVNKTREATKDAFSGAISRVDLIVGPRSGSLSLLLYSVFHVGSPTHNVSMKAVNYAKSRPEVAWVVPFSLGDGYRGFPVVGTLPEFFEHFKIRDASSLRLKQGRIFAANNEVVVGSEVASDQGIKLGDKLVLSHGHTEDGDGFEKHEDHPFAVTGVIESTGTPVDRSVYVSLEGLGEIHKDLLMVGKSGEKSHGSHDHEEEHEHEHDDHDHASFTTKDGKISVNYVSGFFVGARNRMDSLMLQREINNWNGEALMAILPGFAMAELWKNLAIFETAMSIVSMSVVITGIIGLFVSLLLLSGQRQREMVILRAIGAGPKSIFMLLAGEAVVLVLAAIIFGVVVMYAGLWMLSPWIEHRFSVHLSLSGVNSNDLLFAGALLMMGAAVGVIASLKAYRSAMHDGLATRF